MREYLTRKEAADYLRARGVPVQHTTLTKLACIGGGPPYQIFGSKALYKPSELDAWAEARMKTPRRSTSEAA